MRHHTAQARLVRALPSLRTVFNIGAVFYLLVALLVASSLIAVTTLQRRAAGELERATADAALATDVERVVWTYHRVSNVLLLGRGSENQPALDTLEVSVRHEIRRAREHAGSGQYRALVDDVASNFDAYLARRTLVDDGTADLGTVMRHVGPQLDRLATSLERMRAFSATQIQGAHREMRQLQRFAHVVGATTGAALLVVVLASLVAMRTYVVRTLLAMCGAIERFRGGDASADAPDGGPAELRAIARAFNEMKAELVQQRRNQLAFLGGVAHDLRNPLAALKLSVQALLGDVHAGHYERVGRKLGMVDRQLDRLDRMVGDLLDAMRIEAGELELRREVVDLGRIAREVIELYTPVAPAHALSHEVPDEPVLVRGDPVRIEQVVGNLVSNAVKYSPAGGPVRVSVAVANDAAVLAVTDQGIGIPREATCEIFQPFRRGDAARGIAPGVGLGLSVVRRIVRAHGGEIEVESAPGVGSTFRVRLPRAREATAEQRPRAAPRSASGLAAT